MSWAWRVSDRSGRVIERDTPHVRATVDARAIAARATKTRWRASALRFSSPARRSTSALSACCRSG